MFASKFHKFPKGSLTVIRTAAQNASPLKPRKSCAGACEAMVREIDPSGTTLNSLEITLFDCVQLLFRAISPTNGPAHMSHPQSILSSARSHPLRHSSSTFFVSSFFYHPTARPEHSRALRPPTPLKLVKSPNTLHAPQTFASSNARFECQSLIGTC